MRGCDLQRRFVSHGGLTPPALLLRCERLSAKKTIFSMHTRTSTRAAGVSPPWVAETHLQHRYRSRPGTLVTCGDKSGGRQPAVGVGKRTCNGASTKLQQTPDGTCAVRRCIRVQGEHGGLRPPLLVVHGFVHRKSRHFTGTRSRTQTRAAGVSPPWVWATHLQRRFRKVAGGRPRFVCRSPVHSRPGRTRGADAPRSCVARMHVCWGFTISGAGALANPRGAYAPRSW
jgi:hypothetical protein